MKDYKDCKTLEDLLATAVADTLCCEINLPENGYCVINRYDGHVMPTQSKFDICENGIIFVAEEKCKVSEAYMTTIKFEYIFWFAYHTAILQGNKWLPADLYEENEKYYSTKPSIRALDTINEKNKGIFDVDSIEYTPFRTTDFVPSNSKCWVKIDLIEFEKYIQELYPNDTFDFMYKNKSEIDKTKSKIKRNKYISVFITSCNAAGIHDTLAHIVIYLKEYESRFKFYSTQYEGRYKFDRKNIEDGYLNIDGPDVFTDEERNLIKGKVIKYLQ